MYSRISSLLWIVASTVAIATTVLSAQQRRGAPAKTVTPAAVQKAEQEIDKAAAARGILLTDAARRALANEAVHQEATAPAADTAPVTGAMSDTKLSELLRPLADAPQGRRLDASAVQKRVVDEKAKQAVAALPADIDAYERRTQRVPQDVRVKMAEDLTRQTEALSRSGLAVDGIRARNQSTLQAIERASAGRPLTTQTYPIVMAQIFTRQVQLSISSTPEGADVRTGGFQVGKTNITDKPFKPGSYSFTFRLKGYQDSVREFYVTPGIDTDAFTQVLTPEATSGPPATPPEPHGKFPWTYVGLAGVVIVLVVVWISRRR